MCHILICGLKTIMNLFKKKNVTAHETFRTGDLVILFFGPTDREIGVKTCDDDDDVSAGFMHNTWGDYRVRNGQVSGKMLYPGRVPDDPKLSTG